MTAAAGRTSGAEWFFKDKKMPRLLRSRGIALNGIGYFATLIAKCQVQSADS